MAGGRLRRGDIEYSVGWAVEKCKRICKIIKLLAFMDGGLYCGLGHCLRGRKLTQITRFLIQAGKKTPMLLRITEYLDIDVRNERWRCHCCSKDLGSARDSYKIGCLVYDRNPHEVHAPMGPDPEYNFSFDPGWMKLIEFYCPQCATLLETEYLPPGHPLTWDIQIDVDALKQKYLSDDGDAAAVEAQS